MLPICHALVMGKSTACIPFNPQHPNTIASNMQRCCSFINGMKAQHTPLKEARIIFFGAGSSAVGVATMIAQLISKETGISFDEAKMVHASSSLITTEHALELHLWC